ncbi:MAG: hypothetical protein WD250_13270 [Egibacteraceae bacterium]
MVWVLTPGEVAASSADHSDRQVDAALDAAAAQLGPGGDLPAGVETFGRELATVGGGGLDTTDLPGPLSGVSIQTLVIGGIVVLVGGVLGGLAGSALRGRHRRGPRPGSGSRPSRSRGSASRSRRSSSRSRGSASRRR